MAGIMYKNDEDNNYNGIHLIFNSDNDIISEINNNEGKTNCYEVHKCPQHLKGKFDDFMRYHIKTKEALNKINNNKNINETHENNEKIINNISNDSLSKSEDNSANNNKRNNPIINSKKKENRLVYIKNYFINKKAKILILSDDIIQAIFYDKIQIFISDGKDIVGYVNKDKKIIFISSTNIMKNTNKDLVNRIDYIRKIFLKGTNEKVNKKIIKIFDETKKEEEK